MSLEKIIYFRLEWRERYDGSINIGSNKIHECYNFERVMIDGIEKVFGYIPTPFKHDNLNYTIHIENIINSNIDKRCEQIDNVIVVFFSRRPSDGQDCIIGWYKDAVVYRNIQTDNNLRLVSSRPSNNGFYRYQCEASYNDAVELRTCDRKPIFNKGGLPNEFTPFYDKEHKYYDAILKFISEYNDKVLELSHVKVRRKQQIEDLNKKIFCDKDDYLVYPNEEQNKDYPEGAVKQVRVNKYERNPKARQECIKLYGYKCIICGFDFKKVYGEIGENFIHVHHKIPLKKFQEVYGNIDEYQVNPKNDLIPICPNCHEMIHKLRTIGDEAIEELKKIFKRNTYNQ